MTLRAHTICIVRGNRTGRKTLHVRAMDDRRSHHGTELHICRKQAVSSTALLPIMAAVFMAFIVIGLAIPVLPLHVHQGLGLGTFLVGLVAGSQFAAAILSRVWAGRDADIRGAKHAVIAGLFIGAAAGLLYFLSLSFVTTPAISVVILLLGRALLGAGECFIITGAQTWGLALLGVENTSKVLAWVGSAMFAAFALGAPVGTVIYGMYGFVAVAFATTLLPLLTLLFVAPLERVPTVARLQTGLMKVMAVVWVPGVASALSSIGFGAITAFSSLLFVARGWAAWPAFTAFAAAFIVTRLFLGHVADRSVWRRAGRAHLRSNRSSGFGADLAFPVGCAGTGRCCPNRDWVLARLSRVRRQSRSEGACAEPRTRNGRLHRFS